MDRTGPEPIFSQIKNWLREEVARGVWPVHAKLPSEDKLAQQLGVNRGTLRKALAELIEEKILVQIHGRGTFVTAGSQSSRTVEAPLAESLVAFSEDLILQGIPFETEIVSARRGLPEPRVAAFLGLQAGQPAVSLLRKRWVDGSPIAWLENHVNAGFCPGLEDLDWEKNGLFQVLEKRYGWRLSWARRTFEARQASADLAHSLQVEVGAPLLYLEQISYLEDGRPIECSDVWLRGDRFKLSSILTRDGRLTRSPGAFSPSASSPSLVPSGNLQEIHL